MMEPTGQRKQLPFVDLAAQYAAIAGEIDESIHQVLRRTDFILGREVDLFEEEFAAFCGVKHAVGVDSGTSALELALLAHGIGPGDEVITVANTFIATALAISLTGATPVLVDANPVSYTLDVSELERATTPKTRAVIPVHLYGQAADMDPIMAFAENHDLVVIEDACQAHGATYKGRLVGSLGHAAAFSFYPGKNLGAYGDGGAVVTDDDQVADALRMLRNYGQREKYHHLLRGFNRRLDTIQAAILRVKLRHLKEWNAARRQHVALYNDLLANAGVVLPTEMDYGQSVYHLYVIRVAQRDSLVAFLKVKGIATGIHYPIPLHLQPAYRDLGYKDGSFPATERSAGQLLSLPMYPELSDESIRYVAENIREFGTGRAELASPRVEVKAFSEVPASS